VAAVVSSLEKFNGADFKRASRICETRREGVTDFYEVSSSRSTKVSAGGAFFQWRHFSAS